MNKLLVCLALILTVACAPVADRNTLVSWDNLGYTNGRVAEPSGLLPILR